MELLDDLRLKVRRWLGVSQFQKSTRNRLDTLEDKVAVSQADLERLNAATSRIAARVSALLDQIDQLGTGNDDEVRAQALQDAVLQSSADLRPVIEQLEGLGADASNPVPAPAPEQVPVEPGPDVAPVENGEAAAPGQVVTDPAPAPGAPAGDTTTTPDGGTQFDPSGIAVGEGTEVQTDAGAVTTTPDDGTVVGDGAAASQPGPSGDDASPTQRA